MRKLLIVALLLVAGIAESSAQGHIDALMQRELHYPSSKRDVVLRSAVKRDPDTGEIVKRVTELNVRDDKALSQEFVSAFLADCESADTWSCDDKNGKSSDYILVWQNPMRIYSLKRFDDAIIINIQVIYSQDENTNPKTE